MAWLKAQADPRFGWNYMSEPDPHLDGRVQPLPRGKLLGGSSAINGTMWIRGAAADYDGWATAAAGWGYADVLPYFRRSESNWRGAERGSWRATGRSASRPLPADPFLFPKMVETGERLGFPEQRRTSTSRSPEGFGLADVTVGKGRRHSTARAYLDPVRGRANLRVETGALATRVLIEDGRATGVEYRRGGAPAPSARGAR